MSVIVTGAAGHLGRLVAEQLLERLPPEHVVLVTRRPQALRELGARGADVRYGGFDDLQLPPAAVAAMNRRLVTNMGDGRIVPVSRRDCAEAAAITLTTDGHTGKTYEITGPEALSASDLAELYADVSGQSVKVVRLSDGMLIWVLVSIGTPWPDALHITAFGRA